MFMFDSMSGGQVVKIFAAISFFSVFLAMFLYFAIFPVTVSEKCDSVDISVAPWALDAVKNWNIENQGQTVIDLDECNQATRVDAETWEVGLKKC